MSESQKFYYGAFLSLKNRDLVNPDDKSEYEQFQRDAFSKQGVVMIFAMFWARMYELCKFQYMIPNRVLFYGIVGGLPALFHAFIISKELTGLSNTLDEKYQTQYVKYVNEQKAQRTLPKGQRKEN